MGFLFFIFSPAVNANIQYIQCKREKWIFSGKSRKILERISKNQSTSGFWLNQIFSGVSSGKKRWGWRTRYVTLQVSPENFVWSLQSGKVKIARMKQKYWNNQIFDNPTTFRAILCKILDDIILFKTRLKVTLSHTLTRTILKIHYFTRPLHLQETLKVAEMAESAVFGYFEKLNPFLVFSILARSDLRYA